MKQLLLTTCLLLGSCLTASKSARNDALLPAAKLAWGDAEYGVQSDTLRGIEDAMTWDANPGTSFDYLFQAVDDMTAALESGDRSALKTIPWHVLFEYADQGIDARINDGEIVEQAAIFLTRRLENFDQAMALLTDPAYTGLLPVHPQGLPDYPTVPTPLGNAALVATAAR